MPGALDPIAALKDVFCITGPAAMPPRWALFRLRSHRTIEDEPQLLGITEAPLAILDADEARHGDARAVWETLLERDEPCVTTNYVLVETYALTARWLGSAAVRALSDDMLPAVDVEWIDRETHERAVAALVAASRRDLSLVDIVSFDAMRRRGIQTAFAFDRHFVDAGFALVPAE